MGRKIVKNDLLWRCIVWVQYCFAQSKDETKQDRPQRPYQATDDQILTSLIYKVRALYATAKMAHGAGADFDSCKAAVITKEEEVHGWDTPTRNFYSSVVATYISWDYKGISTEAKSVLPTILPLLNYLQRRRYTKKES